MNLPNQTATIKMSNTQLLRDRVTVVMLLMGAKSLIFWRTNIFQGYLLDFVITEQRLDEVFVSESEHRATLYYSETVPPTFVYIPVILF